MSALEKRPRVFVIDGERNDSLSLAMFLSQRGFDASSFTDPFDVLAAIRYESPELVISNATMPQLAGVNLAIQVLGRCPEFEVLLLSERASIAELNEAASESAHAFEVLSKPVQPTDILKMIQKMMQRPRLSRPLVG